TAEHFALPPGFDAHAFDNLQGEVLCDPAHQVRQPRYRTTDIDGDGDPDLVLTSACDPATYLPDPSVGVSRWVLYRNGRSGFAPTAEDFGLPAGFSQGGFADLQGDYLCNSLALIDQPRFRTVDIDGDADPDLVLTIACDPITFRRDPSIGVSRWILYRND